MSHLVFQLGRWVDLAPAAEVYRCRVCGNSISLGNDGKAISLPDGSWLYEHYDKCVPDVPAKKNSKKRPRKHESKA